MWLAKSLLIISLLFSEYKDIPVKEYYEKIEFENSKTFNEVVVYFSEGFNSQVIVKSQDSVIYDSKDKSTLSNSFKVQLDQLKNVNQLTIYVPTEKVKFSVNLNNRYNYIDLYLYKDYCINTFHNSMTINE